MLQNLANDQLFQSKEEFMIPMNTFLKNSKDSLHTFFENVIDVTEPQEYLVALYASILTFEGLFRKQNFATNQGCGYIPQ